MPNSLEIISTQGRTKTGIRDADTIVYGLSDILADTYRLVLKTHAYHWNVTGPLFYTVHKLTGKHYADMFAATDVLAERIRALSEFTPMKLAEIAERSRVEDLDAMPDANGMICDLVVDHERLAQRYHNLIDRAGTRRDPVTQDLATERSSFHEEAAWMLRAIAAD